MSNSAFITGNNLDNIGIYLHWNGGRDSVEAFLKYCELKGYCSPERGDYGWARLCQVIGNYFGGSDTVSIGNHGKDGFTGSDNGVYFIEDWQIVQRGQMHCAEQKEYGLNEMLLDIDEAQPSKEQISIYLQAKEIPISSFKVGDKVAYIDYEGQIVTSEVVGIVGTGDATIVNGSDVSGMPYINKYCGTSGCQRNPNNYPLRGKNWRLIEN